MTDAPTRIHGFDLARALAIVGMVLVNYQLVLVDPERTGGAIYDAVTALQGRAAALFVVLAGVGISLGTRRLRSEPAPSAETVRQARRRLFARALFLLVVGCRDDLERGTSKFTAFLEKHGVADKLTKMSESKNEDLRPDDVRELVLFTLDKLNEARELILNVTVGK